MASSFDAPQCGPDQAAQWRLMDGQSLTMATWGDGLHVVYNDLSGDTHLLGADAVDLLRLLQQDAAAEPALAAACGDADGVAALLAQLAALSLVERSAC